MRLYLAALSGSDALLNGTHPPKWIHLDHAYAAEVVFSTVRGCGLRGGGGKQISLVAEERDAVPPGLVVNRVQLDRTPFP